MIFLQKKNNKTLNIGIDLGTTYSLIATIDKGRPRLLFNKKKNFLLPSVVHYAKNNILVGWDAVQKTTTDPMNTVSSVKRLIGRSMGFVKKNFSVLPYVLKEHECGGIAIQTNIGMVTPVEVESEILKHFQEKINYLFNKDMDNTIITVPAYFNHRQRTETKKAAGLAKINLIRLLNEPTAAAIAYGLENNKEGIIAVYDLGGGTFDISILQLKKGIFEVLATSGDSNLGGDDFDFILAKYIYKKSKLMNPYDNFFQSVLLQTAKKIKINLTKHNIVPVHFFTWKGFINRDEFNALIDPLVKKTLLICFNMLQDIDLKVDKIEEVIMVGGSTRIPFIQKSVSDFFQKTPLNSINPDQVVAIGAATQINMLMGKNVSKTILLDVVPLSLGIEVMGGFVETIIHRNTPIPISQTKEFTTFKDSQTKILIHVVQGERKLIKDCFSLSHFVLKGIPSRKAGMIRILVTFEINVEGLITITASEKSSGIEKKINIDKKLECYKQ